MTAYEIRISDWSSDVCSSDLYSPQRRPCLPALWRDFAVSGRHCARHVPAIPPCAPDAARRRRRNRGAGQASRRPPSELHPVGYPRRPPDRRGRRSEEHTSELQSLMRISYAVFCLKKKLTTTRQLTHSVTRLDNLNLSITTTRLI